MSDNTGTNGRERLPELEKESQGAAESFAIYEMGSDTPFLEKPEEYNGPARPAGPAPPDRTDAPIYTAEPPVGSDEALYERSPGDRVCVVEWDDPMSRPKSPEPPRSGYGSTSGPAGDFPIARRPYSERPADRDAVERLKITSDDAEDVYDRHEEFERVALSVVRRVRTGAEDARGRAQTSHL